jgi:protein involved in polysaccharide export with SLBB domain
MKPKLLLCLAFVLSGGLFGCASHPTQPQSIKVNVLGWVKTPGKYVLPKESGIVAALDAAGGFRDESHSSSLRVIRTTDRQKKQFSVPLHYDVIGKPKADFEIIDGDTVSAKERFL